MCSRWWHSFTFKYTKDTIERGTMVIPVLKLGTLAIRTLSKPIANRIKKECGLHPKFRNFIINIAQANHRFSTTMQRQIYGRATNVLIHPLNEERAVQAAADLIGELFIFAVAGIALIYEVQRNSRAEARREEARKEEIEALKQKGKDLEIEVELLKRKLQVMEQLSRGRSFLDYIKFWHDQESVDQQSTTPS